MPFNSYQYQRARTYKSYKFFSEGPRGRILKKVDFQLFYLDSVPSYNLVPRDWNTATNGFDANLVTNNGDTTKIINTVLAIAMDFTAIFENALIYIEGGNIARTRLYQMAVTKMWAEIDEIFYVCGRKSGHWQPFRKNDSYDAFLVSRTEYLLVEEPTVYYMTPSQKETKEQSPLWDSEDPLWDDEVFRLALEEDSDNDPHVIAKTEAARKSLEKSGLPKEMVDLYWRRQKAARR